MRPSRVLERRPQGSGLFSLSVSGTLRAEPGQFVFVWIPGVGERPLSISGLGQDSVELTVRAIGSFTLALSALQAGDRVGLRGPFGRPFTAPGWKVGAPVHPILVAGGIGVAPLRFLARRLAEAGVVFDLLVGARTAGELCHHVELTSLGASFATDDGSLGHAGRVTELLDVLLEPMEHQGRVLVQACGPEPMLRAVFERAAAREIAVELSFERLMKCGLGICGHCCVPGSGERLCVEGPVLGGVPGVSLGFPGASLV